MDEERLKRQFIKEFAALVEDKASVRLDLTPREAWAVLSNLQLALRHPENNGSSAKMGRRIAERLQRMVASEGALAEVARRGWDQRYDE